MNEFIRDLRFAARTLVKTPVFTIAALFCLALGVGANTAIFSVVNAVILRPLPFFNAERLVVLHDEQDDGELYSAFSPANYLDLRELSQSMGQLAGYRAFNVHMTGPSGPERVRAASVSPGFFHVLGARPVIGNSFRLEGDPAAEGARSIVLSYGSWQQRFGGDPSVIGQALMMNGQLHTIVGVAPAAFRYPSRVEMWVRAYRYGVPEPPVNLGEDLSTVRDFGYFAVLGRLADGVTLGQAQAEMDILGPQLAAIRGGETGEGLIHLVPLSEELTGDIRPALLLLLGAVGFVLLIACANVANLVMARSTAREREVAVRAALGASRARLVRQLLTENVLLGVVGGVVGLLIAVWAVDVLVRMAPTGLFEGFEIDIDNSVMVFALAVSLLTGVVFGVLPALQASKPDLSGSLKEGGRGGSEGKKKRRARELLVVSEVALSLMLLCGAGLLIKSMVRLQSTDVGFQTESLLVMRMEMLRSRYPEAEERNAFLRDVLERVSALPGVSSAGAALALPFSGAAASLHFSVLDRPESADEDLVTEYQVVTPDYFRAMGIPLRGGRTVDDRDDQSAPLVAVINETLARWQWPGDDPIGKRISVGGEEREIVGVVGDVRHFGYDKPPRPEAYIPYYQDPWPFFALVVRTGADPASLAGVVRSQVLAVDGDQPVHSVSTMEQVLSDSIRQGRFTMLLLGLFASVAIALAVVGIYGVMSYSVNQRLHEIGIRMALGAERPEVLRLTMGWGLKLVSAGAVLGLLASVALTRLMSSLLYGISATDPVVFVGVTLLLLSVAAVAAFIPAQRAARFDPLSVLRHE